MTQPSQPGALAADWAHWQALGLTKDLLPVVSDLSAAISPNSTMKSLGKTPSMFNRNGDAVGVPQWTQKRSTDGEIGRWAQDPRLGICIQCRVLRAIDIDIADQKVVDKIVGYITMLTGELPMRRRSNSGKCLLVFWMPGEFVKRVIHTAHGVIEFLANGQQFIAVGTHTSGVRYEWPGGLPEVVPEVTAGEFSALWAGLQDTWGVEPERVARNGLARPTVARNPSNVVDDVAHFLEATGWVRSWTKDGRLNVTCPWESEHTTDTDESATQYLPAGVGGFELGHWKCLHAHCAGRLDGDFLDAVGFMDGEFEDLTTGDVVSVDGTAMAVAPVPDAGPPPAYLRTRGGEVLAAVHNLVMALERADQCGMQLRWDNFRDEIVWAPAGAGLLAWRAFRDHDYMELRGKLERPRSLGGLNFKPVGREMVRDAVHYVAMNNTMDSATMWAESLQWDGVERVETFFHEYFGAVNNPYTRAVGLYAWTALAGRALVPGVQADMAVILKSEQGTVKTQGIKAMAPFVQAFGEIDLGKGDDVLARQTRGKLVCEISELRGLNSREHGAIKSWISRTHEEWVPKFKEFATQFPRRFICFGTTNEDEFLADATGERRWLPMVVGRTKLAALKADVEQLWAEGVHLFRKGGVQWAAAEELAKREHSRFKVQDSWHDVISNWLNDEAFGDLEGICQGDSPVRMHQLLQSALNLNVQNIARKDELRAGAVLRSLGYEPTTIRLPSVFLAKNEVKCNARTSIAGRREEHYANVYRAWVNKSREDAARALRELV